MLSRLGRFVSTAVEPPKPWGPARITALAVPNPSRASQEVRFSIEVPRSVEVVVFDVSGRVLRRIPLGHLEAGAHSAVWDGRNADGLRVPAGTYFARIKADNLMTVVKVIQIH